VLCHFPPISDTKQTLCFRLYLLCIACFQSLPWTSIVKCPPPPLHCKVPAATIAFDNAAAISAAIAAAVAIAVGAPVASAIAIVVLLLLLLPSHHLCAIYSAVIANVQNCCYMFLFFLPVIGCNLLYDSNERTVVM
jgi:hypothetical protein